MAAAFPRLVTLARYTAWANARLYAALALLSPQQLTAATPIFAGSILRTLNHVRLIDRVWQAHLLGEPHGFTTRNPESSPPLAELHDAQMQRDAWYCDYAERLSRVAGDETVAFTFIGGGEGRMARADILLHVANHTTYHRGHITAMLYRLGIEPPVTDLPVFIRDGSNR